MGSIDPIDSLDPIDSIDSINSNDSIDWIGTEYFLSRWDL